MSSAKPGAMRSVKVALKRLLFPLIFLRASDIDALSVAILALSPTSAPLSICVLA